MRKDGQTDRHDEANSRLSLFSEGALKDDCNRIHKAYLSLDGSVVIQICYYYCRFNSLL